MSEARAPRLHFLGVGDAVCTDGPNTSVLYCGELTLLVDCGPSVPQVAWRRLGDPNALDAVWITHQHADHCMGLPTLLLGMRLAGRKKPLELLGGPGSTNFLNAVLELGYPGSFRSEKGFALTFTEISPGRPLERKGLRLGSARSQHRVTCYALRIDAPGSAVCVSGDGKPTPETRALYRGADLVVHECEWATRPSDDHSNVGELRNLIEEARVERLAIVHSNAAERDTIAELADRFMGARAWLARAGEISAATSKSTP